MLHEQGEIKADGGQPEIGLNIVVVAEEVGLSGDVVVVVTCPWSVIGIVIAYVQPITIIKELEQNGSIKTV